MKKLLFTSLLILLFWALFVPSFEYPDEQAHFASVALKAEQGRMPNGQTTDVSQELALTEEVLGTVRDSRGNNRYTYHPENMHIFSPGIYGPREQEILEANNPDMRSNYVFREAAKYPILYYSSASLIYQTVEGGSIFDRLFAVRFFSVLIGVLNVWAAYKIASEIFGDGQYAKIVALMVGLQPMMTFVMSGVNSDVLHNLLFSLILLFCLRIIKHYHYGDSLFYVLVFLTLDFFTKPQAYIGVPLVFLALMARAIYHREIIRTLKTFIILSVIGLGIGYYLKNPQIVGLISHGSIPFINPSIHPQAPGFLDYARYSLDRLIHQNIVWYWGVFKWLGVVLPKPFWWIANRLVIVSLIGLIVGFVKNFTPEQKIKLFFLGTGSALYILAIFMFDWFYIRSHGVQVAVQARYYFPMLTAHMTLLLAGIMGFTSNNKIQMYSSKLILGFFILLQLAGIYTIAKSYFDLSSIQSLFIQASQYKPLFAKGGMWWIWSTVYALGIGYAAYQVIKKQD